MSAQTSRSDDPSPVRRVAILFAGGPAPAANAVISTAAASFLRNGISVVGILNGYSHLVEFGPGRPLVEGKDYIVIDSQRLRRTRNSRGIMIGTARTNPGKHVNSPADLADEKSNAPLRTAHAALASLEVDALVSIGGDDTLKTANKLRMVQAHLPEGSRRIRVVHVPKTIDNDYLGIDFTFGYFTAVETLAGEIRNLLADAEATQGYYLAETMGRSAGWLAYGAAMAGEASLVLSVEDVTGRFEAKEPVIDPETKQPVVDPATGEPRQRKVMNLPEVVRYIVAAMRARERDGKEFGVIVVAEGLAEFLPSDYLKGVPRDEHGHISIAQVDLGRSFARLVSSEYEKATGKQRKVTGLQLGYESRCAAPHAFDVMLGSQLGVGAYRALVEEGHDGVMISAAGQLDLNYVPFDNLIDPQTLVTVVRYIKPKSDFHRLARFLETEVGE
ncbi:6-phosphofructokinase [Tautonia plasticadhaerens]|uniref:6-phosphofructokinase 1 n=1 Tax=Tautonia plasticadhaerens TaxID=2527974 RepID=A0A518H6U0_9BACT|nr:6-phosphofructokinase [Tautonia plasticadhaerens]QDV36597.1 6-phosphofructokinase 1 [Tautonia plasticadhaerens]